MTAAPQGHQAVHEPRLQSALDVFGRWLHLPDPGPVLVTLGTVAANRLSGDAVWLLLVGPPGGGKSEILRAFGAVRDVHSAATLTEGALLSGTPAREHAATARGGLLRVIGEYGVLVAKDFGSVLSMNRDARAAVLAALREIYDGSWTRHVGTDGGRTLHWEGKVGLLAGCTDAIDSHHAVMAAMGERFVTYRLNEMDAGEQARRALAHAGEESAMRAQLSQGIASVLEAEPGTPRALTEWEQATLVALSTLVTRCRSAVERDGRTREVELIHDPEAPTRLVIVLARLLAGLDVIGADRLVAWELTRKVALDCIPTLRRRVLETLLRTEGEVSTAAICAEIGHPSSTTRRTLEDLEAHRVVWSPSHGQGTAARWSLSEWTRDLWSECDAPGRLLSRSPSLGSDTAPRADPNLGSSAEAFPAMSEGCPRTFAEMSGDTNQPLLESAHQTRDDVSGKDALDLDRADAEFARIKARGWI